MSHHKDTISRSFCCLFILASPKRCRISEDEHIILPYMDMIPIRSMGRTVYLPTFIILINVGRYNIHGFYGLCSSDLVNTWIFLLCVKCVPKFTRKKNLPKGRNVDIWKIQGILRATKSPSFYPRFWGV